MKNTFRGYYRPTKDEFSALWNECLFVLDANVLLNLYRYSPPTSEALIEILDKISDRLWVPHQAALEYHKRRLNVIAQQIKAYDAIQKSLHTFENKLEKELQLFAKHPYVDVKGLLEKTKAFVAEIEKYLDECKQKHPDLIDSDNLRDIITKLFEEKVGSSYSPEELKKIYKEGKTRYERKIPPGYQDVDKGGIEQYGDLVLWFQIIDHAKSTAKPIIFITDDRKEDWWLKSEGKTVGPHPYLINEMFSEAGVHFYMYQSEQFMEYAGKYLKSRVDQEAIDEIRDIGQRDEEQMKAMAKVGMPAMASIGGIAEIMRNRQLAIPKPEPLAAMDSIWEMAAEMVQNAQLSVIPPIELATLASVGQMAAEMMQNAHSDEHAEDSKEDEVPLDSKTEKEHDESDDQSDVKDE